MPQLIGRFEVRQELGRGAQSIVYRAWDAQLQREVAIKTMHFGRADARRNEMLLAEARTVSKLHHPNAVPIFDLGEQDGDPYLVFELVEGRTLADQLRTDGPIEPRQAVGLLRYVVDALAHAHALGVIHRDLKPSNILMDGQGIPHVMDFGIASRVGDAQDAQGAGLSGTPSYMAPEYVDRGVITEQVDVYAAGLIMLEMLTARRVIQGDTSQQVLYQVLHGTITPPKGLDERLNDIVLKCCARDPALRYANAGQLREALDRYLGGGRARSATAAEDEEDANLGHQSTLDFLLRRMRHKSDFPALSDSVSAINRLTNSDRESINKLSNTILKDYALTNKILRLVNSAFYRQSGGGSISTVSRAVIVLGFDAIRNIAITVLLFEHIKDKSNARDLKEGFLRANLAGLLARDAGQKLGWRDSEEVFICALFHGLGQLLTQFYFPEELETIRILMQQKRLTEEAASMQVLGMTLEDLGIGIARSWGFPPSIVNSMRKLGEGPVRKGNTMEETMRVVSGFANELCELIAGVPAEGRAKAIAAMGQRFAESVPLTGKQLVAVVEKSSLELDKVAAILHVNLTQSPFARQIRGFIAPTADETPLDQSTKGKAARAADALGTTLEATVLHDTTMEADETTLVDDSRGNDGDDAPDVDVAAVLTAGIQDISNALVEEVSLNDLLRIILETMYRAAGFKRVLLCLRDAKAGQMVGRFGFGPDTAEVVKQFRFPLAFAPDVFHLATSKGVDILISDIDDPKIADKIPSWYREKIQAKTFVIFPLTLKNVPVAMIYCDKERAGSINILEKELQLMKTLRNQAVLAIKQSA